MRKTKRKAFRKDQYGIICILSYICSLIFRIPLLYLIGAKGVAFFSIANEIYILTGGLFTYGLSKAVCILVKFRIKREQYKNADMVLKGALTLTAVLGVLLGVSVFAAKEWIAGQVIGLPMAGLALGVIAFSLIFQLLTGVFRGYFEGNGSKVPTMHSMILKALLLIPTGLISTTLLYRYGVKVSALLKVEDYAASYGAMGAAVGILITSAIGFLHMLVLLLIYHGKAKKQAAKDLQKNQDGRLAICHMLIGTAVSFAGYAVFFRIVPLLDGIFFIRTADEGMDAAQLWGSYYGKYLVVIGIVCFLVRLMCVGRTKRIIYYIDREELRMAREKTGILVHQAALLSIPACVFTAVFSENILDLFFQGSNDGMTFLAALGSVIIILSAFSGLFTDLLVRLDNMKIVIGYEALALTAHIVLIILLLKNTDLSLTAVVISNILFFAVLAVSGFLLLCRALQYRQEWIHTFAFPVVLAAISGIVVMLLNKFIVSFAGTTIALAVCLPLGIIIYMLLLVLTRAVPERELENMAGGGILQTLGRWMKLM